MIFCCFRYISRPFSHLQYTGKQLPPFYFIHFLLLLLNVQLLLRLILYSPSSQFNNSFKRKFLQLRCFVKVILKNTSNQHGIQHRRLGLEMYGQILLNQKLIYLLLFFFFWVNIKSTFHFHFWQTFSDFKFSKSYHCRCWFFFYLYMFSFRCYENCLKWFSLIHYYNDSFMRIFLYRTFWDFFSALCLYQSSFPGACLYTLT